MLRFMRRADSVARDKFSISGNLRKLKPITLAGKTNMDDELYNNSNCKNLGGYCACIKYCADKIGVRVKDEPTTIRDGRKNNERES